MRSIWIVLLVCLIALSGCAWVSSFFGNPPAVVEDGITIVPPSPAETWLDKLISVVNPLIPLVPWGGCAAAVLAAVQQFLKLRRTRKPLAAIVGAVETLRTNSATKQAWSEAAELAITKTGLRKETLTAFANEVKARVGLPTQ